MDLGVQHDGAAANAVLAAHFIQPQDALATLDHALDDPIDRPAVQNLGFALGPHAGHVARASVLIQRLAAVLPRHQRVDTFRANREFYEVYVLIHSFPTESSRCPA